MDKTLPNKPLFTNPSIRGYVGLLKNCISGYYLHSCWFRQSSLNLMLYCPKIWPENKIGLQPKYDRNCPITFLLKNKITALWRYSRPNLNIRLRVYPKYLIIPSTNPTPIWHSSFFCFSAFSIFCVFGYLGPSGGRHLLGRVELCRFVFFRAREAHKSV